MQALSTYTSKDFTPNVREHALEFVNYLILQRGPSCNPELVYRTSVSLRLRGDVEASQHILQVYLDLSGHAAGPGISLHSFAALYQSKANNYVYRSKFREAHDMLRSLPQEAFSDAVLLWNQMMCVGRVLRGQGEFKAARTHFKACADTPQLPKHKRYADIAAFADVCCELAELDPSQRQAYLAEAEILIRSAVDFDDSQLYLTIRHHKGLRRLLLSLIEIDILQFNFLDAYYRSQCILATYSELQEPDIIDRLGHVRALIASARLSTTFHDEIGSWERVLAQGYIYYPNEEVFICGVVGLFLANAYLSFGLTQVGRLKHEYAMRILATEKPLFLIPGIGTYLFRSAIDKIARHDQELWGGPLNRQETT